MTIFGRIIVVAVISRAPLQRLNLLFIFLILLDKLLHTIGGCSVVISNLTSLPGCSFLRAFGFDFFFVSLAKRVPPLDKTGFN